MSKKIAARNDGGGTLGGALAAKKATEGRENQHRAAAEKHLHALAAPLKGAAAL
jgi:hypothetical protein